MTPVWVTLVVAFFGGLVAGIASPLVSARLTRGNWQLQKRRELKYEIFHGATAALAGLITDALDIELQNSKAATKDGVTHLVEMRPATAQTLEQHRSLIAAVFSANVGTKYDEATRARVSIDNVPNMEFEAKRIAFIEAAVSELEIGYAQ